MNRRKFLKKTSSGAIAALFLPLLSFKSAKKMEYDMYKSVEKVVIDGVEWSVSLDIDNRLVKDFLNTSVDEKEIGIYCENLRSKLDLIYSANSTKMKTVDGKILHYITFKIKNSEMEKEEVEFATDHFGKTIVVEIHDQCHAVIRNEKTNLEIYLKFDDDNSAEDLDCFLTTACVFHKGFSDDCHELTTLRNLRKNVMNPNIKYKKLISEYEIIAPKMLLNIDLATNKNEILDHIYNNLVLPSVAFVEAGRNDDAILHYTDYVKEMKKLYL